MCQADIMALDGEDLRSLPLSMRKTNLDRPLARRPDGIFVEQGEIEPELIEPRAFGFQG
jgi:bifunctional non-homologous end joining protein LigD